jgi:acetoacetyl-CoA synthetase
VLSAELYDWFYSTGFPPTAHLISMSGGTDIAGSFVGGSPLLPVYSGEIQAPALGMAISIFPASSTSPSPLPITTPNSPGELVCTKPFPSQPVCFWGSTGAEVYRKAYFERFGAGVWCQGDFIQREESGGWSILGRS